MPFTLIITLLSFFNGLEGWETFASVRFELQYIDELGGQAEMPIFDEAILAKNGQPLTLRGYYLPLEYDRRTIVLSKMPYASCFFCGGGVGQETIAEVQFAKNPRRFIPDEIIRVRGTLKLNNSDFDHFVFILENAELIE
ncbi:MAG: DUF3299 domain-containing protein [Bacteroidota bacterium]